MSVRARRSARVSGPDFFSLSDASHFCASGLIVNGIGTTRTMCAVPSGSKVAESFGAVGFDCAAKDWISTSTTKKYDTLDFIGIVVPERSNHRKGQILKGASRGRILEFGDEILRRDASLLQNSTQCSKR